MGRKARSRESGAGAPGRRADAGPRPVRAETAHPVPLGRRILAAGLNLSGVLLLIGMAPVWPAWYDRFLVKIVVCLPAIWAAYMAYDERRPGWALILGLLAVGFNPIWPLPLSRGNWVAVYVVAAAVCFGAAQRFRRSVPGIFKPKPRIP